MNFSEIGIGITWKLIDLGFKGSDVFKNELSAKEIIDFATMQMLKTLDEEADIASLACEYVTNEDEINDLVKKLALKEDTEYCIEYRKWQVLYVKMHLPKADTDFFAGLLELGDIWCTLEFPTDSPHIFQGKDNNITPKQYYTQENYNYLLRKHVEWIENEVRALQQTSSL